ncbi:ABC transporter ATP-binding protein [Pontibacillus litoralis]|uniref:Sugar ABC transporter ATP-binding protein n=1 Tax=Pontibacillus litoralis JSM 072002 TaxID=1385512 RepID=A0A0A5G0U2_9BACI|nr:ABC transporter ATP-binding protein [Pontibacillus litoralis]KGX85659.1 sugar ABC transporter ATP-binding protein [Pontibacillus litoralis JSM 072002]
MGQLQLNKLTKQFTDHLAVDQIDLQVNDGEFVVLVGPSGCGKSTTLRMIAGLESISSGDLILNGTRLNDTHSSNRNMAMVFQSYALYPHMSVFENIAFGMKVRKVNKNIIKQEVEKAAKILQLENLLNRKPGELSGGQKQRVAIGRALVREPEVFLMDEPLSNLDAKLRTKMRSEIKELQQKLKATMIYVTHDQVEAMTMGDKIVVMKDGQVQQIGAPVDVYNKPINRFVGGFIGSPPMNFTQGVLSNEGGKLQLMTEQHSIILSHDENIALQEYVGKKLLIGVRPEEITLGNEGDEYSYSFTVTNTEVLGKESLIFYTFDEHNMWNAKLFDQYTYQTGDTISLQLKPEVMHVFDADTEERLADHYQLSAN